jgi:AcrR family transcriptional regulator
MARPRSDIRPRILAAARKRFLRDGVDGASLRSIAKGAHTSIGMIYYYFPTKDALFYEVVEEVYAKVLEDFAQALGGDRPAKERVRALYRRVGRMSDQERDTVRLIFQEALVSSERFTHLIERFKRGHVPLVIAALADGVREGEIDDRVHPALLFLSALAVGVVPQVAVHAVGDQIPFGDLPRGEALSDALVDVLFGGISPHCKRRIEP